MERMTNADLEQRIATLNRLMEERGSRYRYQVQARNGHMALDRFMRDPDATISLPDSVPGRGYGWVCQAMNVHVGTKGEIGTFLHAMMTALDDAAIDLRMTTVDEMVADALAEHMLDPVDSDCALEEQDGRWLLLERGRFDKSWATLHDTPSAAGHYSLNQEYAEDWAPAVLIDTKHGTVFVPDTILWAVAD